MVETYVHFNVWNKFFVLNFSKGSLLWFGAFLKFLAKSWASIIKGRCFEKVKKKMKIWCYGPAITLCLKIFQTSKCTHVSSIKMKGEKCILTPKNETTAVTLYNPESTISTLDTLYLFTLINDQIMTSFPTNSHWFYSKIVTIAIE